MLERKTYAYTADSLDEAEVLNTDTYTYGDAGWKDKLTAYNGQDIVYDAIGNPLDDGTWTYQWQRGRLLTQMQSNEHAVSYVCDHNGMRVKKIVDGVATDYLLRGSQIIHLTRGDTQLHFYYDAQGKPCVATYGGADYYYLYNLQGDVVGLADSAKKVVVEYTYDPWGKPLTCTGAKADTLGADNPFRYRAYVWDGETGVYYLQSRYYNPSVCRFINADTVIGSTGGLLSHNIYNYCGNDPINMADPSGMSYVGNDFVKQVSAINPFFGLIAAVVVLSVAVITKRRKSDTISAATPRTLPTPTRREEETQTADRPQTIVQDVAVDQSITAKPTPKAVVFTPDPDDFRPVGLTVKDYSTPNGLIRFWGIYATRYQAVFEYNEDLRYSPHYHIYNRFVVPSIRMETHYLPGSIVPEPYSSMYFPFGQ